MWDEKIDEDRYLYHYTKPDTALDKILANNRLLIGSIVNTNDPRERKFWLYGFQGDRPLSDDIAISFIARNNRENEYPKNDNVRYGWKVICFTIDDIERTRWGDSYWGRGFAHPRMWAQYGSNHAGVCLVFDKHRIDSLFLSQYASAKGKYSEAVEYDDHPAKGVRATTMSIDNLEDYGIEEAVNMHIQANWKELFFLKSLDWRDEMEYRYVVFTGNLEDEFIELDDSLVGMVLGDDLDDKLVEKFETLASSMGIQIRRMHWRNGKPQLKSYLYDQL